jgi:hypothetical protein
MEACSFMAQQLEVTKTDQSVEEYLHTKVLGTINNAFDQNGLPDVFLAQELADVVTYYLYHNENTPKKVVSSSEILSIIKVVLTTTGHDAAAAALANHHYERRLKRNRVEVASIHVNDLSDAQRLWDSTALGQTAPWTKSLIAADLMTDYDMSRQSARAIATIVEERVFNVGINLVPASLIKVLVLSDAAMVLRAQEHLQTSG